MLYRFYEKGLKHRIVNIYTILIKDLVIFAALSAQLFLREVTSAERGAQLSTSTSALVMAVAVNCNISKAELLITCSARPADLSWHTLSRQGRRYHAYHNVRHFNTSTAPNHWLRAHLLHYILDEVYGTLSCNDSLITSSLLSLK